MIQNDSTRDYYRRQDQLDTMAKRVERIEIMIEMLLNIERPKREAARGNDVLMSEELES